MLVTVVVLTNAALVSFTMDQFSHWHMTYRLCLFLGITVVCFIYRNAMAMRIAETPAEVVIQQQRAEFISKKLIHCVPDRDDNFATDIL